MRSRPTSKLDPALGLGWRFAALAGLTFGLALSPAAAVEPPRLEGATAAALVVVAALARSAPRRGGPTAIPWLVAVALAAAVAGLVAGQARLAVIDAGAARPAAGTRVTVAGYVAAVPRRDHGTVAVRIQTRGGRLLVEAPEPVPDLEVGGAIRASGTVHEPQELERAYLERLGIARVLAAKRIEPLDLRRRGLAGLLDGIRIRGERALSTGTPEASASLLRGFVLGQDDRIDAATVEDFKRSGLAHLLAVSGQNVVLLAVLAAAALGALGVEIRTRLVTILVLIAIYVPVTGAGPSIQRAGAMGAAGVVAALAGRPRSRWYAILLAAAVTLGLDPRACADVGWQLSFAAVIGIAIFAAPLATLLAGAGGGPARRALAEVAALTIAATAATGPLMAFHFGTVSLTALPANLLAAPAEAPLMWLGMMAAAAGQLPGLPVAPITGLAGLLAAYIAQIADWLGTPSWAQAEVELGSGPALVAVYLVLLAAPTLALRLAGRRRRLRPPQPGRDRGARAPGRGRIAIAAATIAACALLPLPIIGSGESRGPRDLLRVTVLDVGQGSATLIEPARGQPILLDAGPPDADVAGLLAARGVDRLGALAITHTDTDHTGGAAAVLESTQVDRLLYARADRATLALARAAGARLGQVTEGSAVRARGLRLDVLWPPADLLRAVPGSEPNAASLAVLVRSGRFEMLIAGDAEAELAPIHPGDVDVLEVAHHGSEDAGLPRLLTEAEPELAVISVGADNPYGHPASATLAELARPGSRC